MTSTWASHRIEEDDIGPFVLVPDGFVLLTTEEYTRLQRAKEEKSMESTSDIRTPSVCI